MRSFFLQAYARDTEPWGYFRNLSLVALGVVFILSGLQPFGIETLPPPLPWTLGLAFGGITWIIVALNYLWVLAFPGWFAEKNWTLGKELLFTSYSFLSVATGNFVGGKWLLPGANLFDHFGYTLLLTVLVGLLPYLLMTYLAHSLRLKRYWRQAQALDARLATATPANDPWLDFSDDPSLLPPIRQSEWLLAEADGNYLRLWVRKAGVPTDYRLRGTIKALEDRLAPQLRCFRSHRAFLVNLDHIQQIEGNAAGYRLTMDPEVPAVPVSRSRAAAFKAALEK